MEPNLEKLCPTSSGRCYATHRALPNYVGMHPIEVGENAVLICKHVLLPYSFVSPYADDLISAHPIEVVYFFSAARACHI